jgi:hypothetical protein
MERGCALEEDGSDRPKVVPFRTVEEAHVTAEVGGPVNEVGVTLAIYGEKLDPEEITRALGVAPTKAHRRGERTPKPWSEPARLDAWFLSERGRDAEPSEAVIDRVLRQLPEDTAVWRELGARYDIQLRFGLHMVGWNQGMGISSEQVARIALMGAKMEFDIYAYGDDE